MGRGRAKAKMTKVARELKYSTPNTDLTALQRELAAREAAEDALRDGAAVDADDAVDAVDADDAVGAKDDTDDSDEDRWAVGR